MKRLKTCWTIGGKGLKMKFSEMPDSYISPAAKVAPDCTIGRYCVISDGVQVGAGCEIANHVVIYPGTVIGEETIIQDHTVIGKPPLRGSISAVQRRHDTAEPAHIGSRVCIGAQVVIYNQTSIGDSVLCGDTAAVRERVTVGENTIIGRLVTVENDTVIGCRCKLETGSYITAYSELGDDCFIAPMVMTANDNFIGRTKERFKYFKGVTVRNGGRIGVGAIVLPGREIGEEGVVAAGSIVTGDVEPKSLVMGSPARHRRGVPPNQWVENQ